jgi:ribonuclease Z
MAPRFHPRLVNTPFDDPALYIAFAHEKRAILFDLGDIRRLAPRDILKISHCFISHTHMDHFCGFDHMLRLCLGRDKQLHLYGPEGFLDNLEGKLRSYNWNLVGHYRYPLQLSAAEITFRKIRTRHYACENGFMPREGKEVTLPSDGVLHKEPSLRINVALLDHGIPSLAFCLTEPMAIQIDKDALDRLDLVPGPWLGRLKEALLGGRDETTAVTAPTRDGGHRSWRLGDLARRITRESVGQKIGYITDAAGHQANQKKMIALVRNADHLFIESPFLSRDHQMAASKYHLTAGQAGEIAALANAKRFTLFHFSPRYNDDGSAFWEEARSTYAGLIPTTGGNPMPNKF